VNLYGYANNNPTCRSDRLGLSFIVYERGYEPEQGDKGGATRLVLFSEKVKLDKCDCRPDTRPESSPGGPPAPYHEDRRRIYFKSLTTIVSVWWHDDEACAHEERHVNRYEQMHNSFEDYLKWLASMPCMSEAKGQCFYDTIPAKKQLEQKEAYRDGLKIDDLAYGLDPDERQKLEELDRSIEDARTEFLVSIQRCHDTQ